MSDINKQIEEMAEKMEKSQTTPTEKLQAVIKSLGKDGLKAKLAELSEDDKIVLKATLEEMNLQKGGEGSGVKGHTKPGGTITVSSHKDGKTLSSETKVYEKPVGPGRQFGIGSSTPKHTTADLDPKKLKEAQENVERTNKLLGKAVTFDDAYAAKMIQGKITDTIIQEDIASDDADEKLVKPAANKMNHQGTPTDGWQGQVIKSITESEEAFDQLIEKAMEKCKDDKMIMKKLKEKGMDESKVQGALDKYKAKKEVKKSDDVSAEDIEKGKMKEREAAKEKIMGMEEKEHGTKDPKKLVQAEKKEHMKKSTVWEDENRLLKANTQGRNFHFNVEQFIDETIANEPQETVTKSETKKDDLNDLIQKGEDRNWDQVNEARRQSEVKTNGSLVKSFADEHLAEAMGMTVEELNKILG